MFEEGIYKYINRMSVENAYLPYNFQNPYIAGRRDISYVFWEDQMPFSRKEKLAMELMENVVACMEGQSSRQELSLRLSEEPIFLFLTKFKARIQLYLSEKLVDENQLYCFAIKLTTQSVLEDEVKLGMIILSFFENDITKRILKTLGLHSAFTLYALEASKNFMYHNQFVYELVQGTCGYGKLAALYLLEPVQVKQKRWVFQRGAINEVMPNMSAIICLEKVDMAVFYHKLILNSENFSKLSYLLAYAAESTNIKEFTQSLMLVEKHLDVAQAHGKLFIDLAAIIIIEKSMAPYWEEHGVDVEKQNGWSSDKESEIRKLCNDISKQSKWRNIILCELSMPQEQTSLIILVLEKLGMLLNFEELIPLLQRDKFDMDILKHVLIENPKHYLVDVFKYLKYELPEAVVCENPQEILEENITSGNKADIWLVYLLKALRKERIYEEELFIDCLTVRFPDVRIEAIQALRTFKIRWSEKVLPALEYAYETEPVNNIGKRLLRLMGKRNDEKEKEQCYLDTLGIMITPSPFDIRILSTKIAGTYYRDLTIVEDQIKIGDILYLVREPENKYDAKAIMVADENGYVLGYVPKVDNAMLAAMIDAGEKLYALLLSDNLENGKPDIQIMLSKKQKQVGNVIQFP